MSWKQTLFSFNWSYDLTGVQLEMRIPGNTTNCRISGLDAGLEYNINVFAVINNSISVPNSITVWTCKCSPGVVLISGSHRGLKYDPKQISKFTFLKKKNSLSCTVIHVDVHTLCLSLFFVKSSQRCFTVSIEWEYHLLLCPLVVILTCNTCLVSLTVQYTFTRTRKQVNTYMNTFWMCLLAHVNTRSSDPDRETRFASHCLAACFQWQP